MTRFTRPIGMSYMTGTASGRAAARYGFGEKGSGTWALGSVAHPNCRELTTRHAGGRGAYLLSC